jgi:hypothetical protein
VRPTNIVRFEPAVIHQFSEKLLLFHQVFDVGPGPDFPATIIIDPKD